jgi:hypothetical protein
VSAKSRLTLNRYYSQSPWCRATRHAPGDPVPQAAHGLADRVVRPAVWLFQELGFIPAVYRRVLRRVCLVQQADQLVQARGQDDDES